MSGLPKSIDLSKLETNTDRAVKLGRAEKGSGHDCYLKGILVSYYLTCPHYFWLQWQRYHFHDIISSQSKMHKLLDMDLENQFNEKVTEDAKNLVEKLLGKYKEGEIGFSEVLSNVPLGLELTAGVYTNYLQLKSIYHQRRNHKLPEWQYFCDWIESLPLFTYLVLDEDIIDENG